MFGSGRFLRPQKSVVSLPAVGSVPQELQGWQPTMPLVEAQESSVVSLIIRKEKGVGAESVAVEWMSSEAIPQKGRNACRKMRMLYRNHEHGHLMEGAEECWRRCVKRES